MKNGWENLNSKWRNVQLKTFYIWASLLIIAIGLSAWFAYKNLHQKENNSTANIVVEAQPAEPAVVAAPYINNNPQNTCDEQPEYKKWKRELAKIVNNRYTRQNQKKLFLNKLEKWRKSYGLPFSVGIDAGQAVAHQIVFNNCRPAFNGKVHQVFVSQVLGNKSIQVLGKDGKLKEFPLRTSGFEVVTVDELNKKGIPFRSWFVPFDEGMWLVKGNDLYLSFDIEDVWLKISSKGQWSLATTDKKALKLEKVDPLTIPGCVAEDQCFNAGSRAFKRSQ
jgi:hypothetical protein